MGTILGIYIIGHDILRLIFGITSIIPLILIDYYLKNLEIKRNIKINKTMIEQTQTRKIFFLITSIILGVIGIIYTFLNYKTIKFILKIGLGLNHNDHVMIGIVTLIIALVSFYKYLK